METTLHKFEAYTRMESRSTVERLRYLKEKQEWPNSITWYLVPNSSSIQPMIYSDNPPKNCHENSPRSRLRFIWLIKRTKGQQVRNQSLQKTRRKNWIIRLHVWFILFDHGLTFALFILVDKKKITTKTQTKKPASQIWPNFPNSVYALHMNIM